MRARVARIRDLERLVLCELEHTTRTRWMLEQYALLGCTAFVIGDPVQGALWCREMNGRAEIVSVTVLKSARGKGLGTKLLYAAHDWAQAQGLHKVFLDVVQTNETAIGLYVSLGYRRIGRPRAGVCRMQVEL